MGEGDKPQVYREPPLIAQQPPTVVYVAAQPAVQQIYHHHGFLKGCFIIGAVLFGGCFVMAVLPFLLVRVADLQKKANGEGTNPPLQTTNTTKVEPL